MTRVRAPFLLAGLLCALTARADRRIELIEFFGYEGIDVAAVRQALPLHEGDLFTNGMRASVRAAVKQATGRAATDVATICCTEHGHSVLFIGLPGKSSRTFRLNPKPTGAQRLSPELLALMERLDPAEHAAVEKGGDSAAEDDSEGYALSHDPASRALQLQLRDYARANEDPIYAVLESSSDAAQRAQAAIAIGYGKRSAPQTAALISASRDPDADVRDEATRALGVLLTADPSIAKQVHASDFIEMLYSGVWMDRNKGLMVLEALIPADASLMPQLKQQAWAPLMEMAMWRDTPHAGSARVIIGHILGIPDQRLLPLAMGNAAAFAEAVK